MEEYAIFGKRLEKFTLVRDISEYFRDTSVVG